MKKLLLSISLLFALNASAQDVKFSEIATTKFPTVMGVCNKEIDSYTASDGATYKAGDKIKLGIPSSNKTFAFVQQGDGVFIPVSPLTASGSGSETEIIKILINGTKRAGFSATFITKGAVSVIRYRISFENALANGEVKGFGKSSDEALAELKKAKDKLDLGLITQEQFEQSKIELSKYIK